MIGLLCISKILWEEPERKAKILGVIIYL